MEVSRKIGKTEEFGQALSCLEYLILYHREHSFLIGQEVLFTGVLKGETQLKKSL